MLKKRKIRLGQSTLEYAVLIVLVAIALLATQAYLKRAMQGRLKQSADDLGDQFSIGASNIVVTSTSTSESRETVDASRVTSSNFLTDVRPGIGEYSTRRVTTQVGRLNTEDWGVGK